MPSRLAAEIGRQVDRLELTMQQLAAVEAARDAALGAERTASPIHDTAAAVSDGANDTATSSLHCEGPGSRLLRLKGIGAETASVALWRFVTQGVIPTGATLKPVKAG